MCDISSAQSWVGAARQFLGWSCAPAHTCSLEGTLLNTIVGIQKALIEVLYILSYAWLQCEHVIDFPLPLHSQAARHSERQHQWQPLNIISQSPRVSHIQCHRKVFRPLGCSHILLRYSLILKWIKYIKNPQQSTQLTVHVRAKTKPWGRRNCLQSSETVLCQGTDLGKGTKTFLWYWRSPRTQWPPSLLNGRSLKSPRCF